MDDMARNHSRAADRTTTTTTTETATTITTTTTTRRTTGTSTTSHLTAHTMPLHSRELFRAVALGQVEAVQGLLDAKAVYVEQSALLVVR
jgi:hypothetical protein